MSSVRTDRLMSRRKTTEEFIAEAIVVHGDRYGYDKVVYVNAITKVEIECHAHGYFEQRANHHLKGHGCAECAGMKKLSTEEFISKAKIKHGDTYGYDKVDYINAYTKVNIICDIHGVFEQTPSNHLSGQGCAECAGRRKLSTEEFISKAKIKHGNRYNYDKVEYINAATKVEIECHAHGVFEQTPNNHLKGSGCPECHKEVTQSKAEKELQGFVAPYYPDMTPNDRTQIRSTLTGELLEFDIWIPSIQKAIEFNGGYWHSKPDAIIRDKIKADQCIVKGIDLLVVHEDDWEYDKQSCLDNVLIFIGKEEEMVYSDFF